MIRPTHTFATLGISPDAHAEIKQRLLAADYGHAVIGSPAKGCILDMHGIGLTVEQQETKHIDGESVEALLHRLWTRAVGTPDYVKNDWKTLQAYIQRHEAADKRD